VGRCGLDACDSAQEKVITFELHKKREIS